MSPKKTPGSLGAKPRKIAPKTVNTQYTSHEQTKTSSSPRNKRIKLNPGLLLENELIFPDLQDQMDIVETQPFPSTPHHSAGDYGYNEYHSAFSGTADMFNQNTFKQNQSCSFSGTLADSMEVPFMPVQNVDPMEFAFGENCMFQSPSFDSSSNTMWQVPFQSGDVGNIGSDLNWFPASADTSFATASFSTSDPQQESFLSNSVPPLTFDPSSPEENIEPSNNEELVGVGLYEDRGRATLVTDSFRTQSQFNSQDSFGSATGKGLVLEETWQPPSHLVADGNMEHSTENMDNNEADFSEIDAEGDHDDGQPEVPVPFFDGNSLQLEPFPDFPFGVDMEAYNCGEYGLYNGFDLNGTNPFPY